jgi:Tol biopolymer transport system component
MNADGSYLTRLTSGTTFDWSPVWSPDGEQIAFLSFSDDGNEEIYIMNADGSNIERLTNNQSTEGYPVWSPDGKSIAFVSNRDEPDPSGCETSPEGCNTDIFVIDIQSLNEVRLTDSPSLDEGLYHERRWLGTNAPYEYSFNG